MSAPAWLEAGRAWAEAALARALPAEDEAPARLHAAMRYALLGGGKRLRPALVRLVCLELGGAERAAEAPAVALELVHTYSLVHDDLPAMDDDELRRGRPTVHVAFDEA
ncbi:MAG: polyprenyl synthetase family protein, partial [Planctomycetota bacterium]